jgi:hypothetical protein
MTVDLVAERTVVRRMRIRRSTTDPMLARLRAATLLSSAALTPPGVSPAAILILRRLQDPMPGRLGLRGGGIRLPDEWERAVRSQVDVFARRAVRPAREGTADAADAVLFADHAELLACLARDWLRGALQRWWWRALLPDRDAVIAVARAWLERPECIPAAMIHLAESGDGAPFVARLGRRVVRDLLEAVLAAHALPELRAALAPIFAAESPTDVTAADRTPAHGEPLHEGDRGVPPPWRSGALHATAAFSDTISDAFIGVCGALHQEPHRVRSRDFAVQTGRWAALQSSVSAGRATQRRSTPEEKRAAGAESRDAISDPRDEEAPTARQSEPLSPAPERPIEQEMMTDAPERVRRPDTQPAQDAHAQAIETERIADRHEQMVRQALDELRIETRFGGVFFLVNLALLIGLYGDFTRPARRGLSLPIWDFVALVSERLAGAGLREDPVWRLLAHLANRNEAQEPGYALSPRRQAALRRWLARLSPRLRERLVEALGPDTTVVLLERRAHVWVTPTRLDATFALAELPVEVRCSGLDRDPGWVPAAGRSLYFHFD